MIACCMFLMQVTNRADTYVLQNSDKQIHYLLVSVSGQSTAASPMPHDSAASPSAASATVSASSTQAASLFLHVAVHGLSPLDEQGYAFLQGLWLDSCCCS